MRYLLLLLSSLLLANCSIPTPLLDRIRESGELVVATRNSATTYYEGRDGMTGLEYELVQRFAQELGVKVRFVVPKNFDETLPMVVDHQVHFAAAGLTVTQKRKTQVRFTPGYQKITQQLIFRNGMPRPEKVEDTVPGIFEIIAGSSHEEELIRRREQIPDLQWTARRDISSEGLLYLVREQVIDYTVADSNEVDLSQRYYPELLVAFNLTQPEDLAWAFPHSEDSSLYDAACDFLQHMKTSGQLAELIERFYGNSGRLGFVDTNTFKLHVLQRLPFYMAYYHTAAEISGIDWKLLAAIGYQESHWDPDAVSPTGVRGIMMLTVPAAQEVGITDRTDPEQSIIGGARYMQIVESAIPDRIEEPDRMWLALAAYNVGLGHLEDARILAQRKGDNPDKWSDVKRYLPLLSRESYFTTLQHGYARGQEPVDYVDNIRSYYELLSWLVDQDASKEPIVPPGLNSSSVL